MDNKKEEICCAEAPKRTIGDLVRENTEIIFNIESLLKNLNEFLFNETIENTDKINVDCLYDDIELQNYKLKNIIENLQKTNFRVN